MITCDRDFDIGLSQSFSGWSSPS